MAAIANNKKFAKKAGIAQSVGKEFHDADKNINYAALPDKLNETSINMNNFNEIKSKIDKLSRIKESVVIQSEPVKLLKLTEYELTLEDITENFGPSVAWLQPPFIKAIATDGCDYWLTKLDNGNYVAEAAANKTMARVAADHVNHNEISKDSIVPKSEVKKPKSLVTLATIRSITQKV